MEQIIPIERIEKRIFLIRGQKVMLDYDLADLYGLPTKALNQAVKRNRERFPDDFMFQLTQNEKDELVTICDRLKNIKHSSVLPHVFTEHGTLMLANVLKSQRAVQTSIQIMRAFVRLRQMISTNKDLSRRLDDLEKKYDHQFKVVFDAIRQLMTPPPLPPKRRIGF